jgi:hypothetical protein
MNHSNIQDLELYQMENTRLLQLLDALIENTFKRLENNSVQPKIRDALKAIQLRQKVAKSSESKKMFWELIDSIRDDELKSLYPQNLNLEDQIIKTIIGLKHQVKNGILPVKLITDAFNQGRSKESKLTYHRIGRLLSSMGFRKAKTRTGTYAILWDDRLLDCDISLGSGSCFDLLPRPSGRGMK